MRHSIGWFVLAGLLTACAPHGGSAAVPAPERIISTKWTTVRALAPGTEVGVALDGDEVRYGRVNEVDEHSLTLWERHGTATIPRDRVARLALRTSIGTTRAPRVAAGAIAGALVGSVIAALVTSIDENGPASATAGTAILLGTGLGAALGSTAAPTERFRERVIYIRP